MTEFSTTTDAMLSPHKTSYMALNYWSEVVMRSGAFYNATLLDGFAYSGRIILLILVKFTYMYLWSTILLAISTVVIWMPLSFLGASLLLSPVMILLLGALFLCLDIRYRFVPLSFMEHPEKGIFAAFHSSVLLMEERYKKTLIFYLSFWRWHLVWLLIILGLNTLSLYPILSQLIAQGGISTPSEADALLAIQPNQLWSWIALFFSWAFSFFYLPRFFVALGVYYTQCKIESTRNV